MNFGFSVNVLQKTCLILCALCFAALSSGCKLTFLNVTNKIPQEYQKIYVPAAVDETDLGGHSIAISSALRMRLGKRADVSLVSVDKARIGIWIHILHRDQKIASVDNCQNPGTPTVGSGAYVCSEIHPSLQRSDDNANQDFDSKTQPTQSPRSETLSLQYQFKIIDLNSGELLYNGKVKTPPVEFNEIGDAGDGRTLAYLQKVPQLHALRYQETVDATSKKIANNIATDIENQIVMQLDRKHNAAGEHE